MRVIDDVSKMEIETGKEYVEVNTGEIVTVEVVGDDYVTGVDTLVYQGKECMISTTEQDFRSRFVAI